MLLKLCDLHQHCNDCLDLVRISQQTDFVKTRLSVQMGRGSDGRSDKFPFVAPTVIRKRRNTTTSVYQAREGRPEIEPWTSQLPLGHGVHFVFR